MREQGAGPAEGGREPTHGMDLAPTEVRRDDREKSRAIRERIRGMFDRAAKDYAHLERHRDFYCELATSLVSLAEPLEGKRILDVGCGTGASLGVLRGAAGRKGSVVGLDVSLGMLREAKQRWGDSAPLILGDGCNFDRLFRGKVDVIVYNAVLFLLPDASASLEAAARVLSPGGYVLISSLEGLYVGMDRRPASDALADEGYKPGRHSVSPWSAFVETLERLFPSPIVRKQTYFLSAAEFLSFLFARAYECGAFPHAALPGKEERAGKLARYWEDRRESLEQSWTLVVARKPEGGEE